MQASALYGPGETRGIRGSIPELLMIPYLILIMTNEEFLYLLKNDGPSLLMFVSFVSFDSRVVDLAF